MALTIVRLPSSTQIGSFLTQASASATYLTQASASNTYITQSSASSTYLTQSSALSTYLDKISASTTYAPLESPTFTGAVSATSLEMSGIIDLNNYNITGVGNLEFSDPGADEGLSWLGGNLWKIYESPNDNVTASVRNNIGNLQFVQNTTRRLTIDATTGDITTQKNLYIGDERTTTEGTTLQIGVGRTANGYAFVDLVGDTGYPDYGARFLRGNSGSNTVTQILHKGTGALQITAVEAGSISLGTSNTSRLGIDSAGRVTKPAQPFFHATSSQATALGNDIFWNFVQNNVGTPSHYNPANGTFTAPVAGAYYFSAHGLWANGDAGDFRVGLFKNGSTIQGSNFISDKYAGRWLTFHINDIIYLAANDFVTVRYFQGGSALHTDGNYNGFTGWLLG